MKILLVSQYFYPEEFKCNDVAFELVKRGYEVTVVTGIPNYPKGTFFKGYGFFSRRRENLNGVNVIRLPLVPRGKGGKICLFLNYFSWAIIASVWALFHALFYKYDKVIVHETSPVMQAFPAIIIKKIQKIPFLFWVLDLWPESLASAGGVSNKRVLGLFESMVKYLYKYADKILISSKGFEKSICSKGDFESKIVYFPNWAEDLFTQLEEVTIPNLPKGFNVMFAGNVGEAQDFEHILNAALILKEHNDIHWNIVGDGRKLDWVKDFVEMNSLDSTVHLYGRHPLATMPSFFKKADVMLVTLKDELIFNLTVPAKLQAYMASTKTIIAMLNGDGAELIKEANCGLVSNAGSSTDLARNVLELSKIDKEKLAILGLNGKKYFDLNFKKEKCIDHLCQLLSN